MAWKKRGGRAQGGRRWYMGGGRVGIKGMCRVNGRGKEKWGLKDWSKEGRGGRRGRKMTGRQKIEERER